jgi:hypothetical protein
MSYFDAPFHQRRACAIETCTHLVDTNGQFCSVHSKLPQNPATKKRAKRRDHDAYYTFDPRYTLGLLAENLSIEWPFPFVELDRSFDVLEPCVGDGGISKVLRDVRYASSFNGRNPFRVHTSDIVPGLGDFTGDASKRATWDQFPEVDWIITNPPYSAKLLIPIIENALSCGKARAGVAMFLRLSYLEPCHNRAHLHRDFKPDQCIVMPRLSFTQDGGKDQVTCAWFVWDFHRGGEAYDQFKIITHDRLDTYMGHPDFVYSGTPLPVSA